MNTAKIREALADLEQQRGVLESAINNLHSVLAMLGGDVHVGTQPARQQHAQPGRKSYVTDTISVLESNTGPLHITAILEGIRAIRGVSVARPSVESAIIRHIKEAGAGQRIVKVSPSTYDLIERQHKPDQLLPLEAA